MTERPLLQEHWADHIHLSADSPEEIGRLQYLFEKKGLPALPGTTEAELPKTEEEIELIKETVSCLNFFRGLMGKGGIWIGLNRFHVLDEAGWKSIDGLLGLDGAMALGHCYLRRHERRIFALNLAHELSHVGGYMTLRIQSVSGQSPEVSVGRNGLGHYRGEDRPYRYHGLMEAVTEMSAVNIRRLMARNSRILTAEENEWIDDRQTYLTTVSLVMGLIRHVTEISGLEYKDVVTALIMDHFRGGYRFRKILRQFCPEAIPILRDMNATDEDALQAAHQLKFSKIIQLIESLR